MLSIALWSLYCGLAEFRQFLHLSESPVNVRIYQAQCALTRTFLPITAALLRWGPCVMQPSVPFISCGVPESTWQTLCSNQNTCRSDWNMQFGEWVSEMQWTAFIYVAWYALLQRSGAIPNTSKYLSFWRLSVWCVTVLGLR